jgi:hypothetical protein
MINVETKSIGTIQAIIRDKNLKIKETINFNNNLLRNGREALASSLANQIGNSYDFFISKMVFGDGGTSEGIPKFVSSDRIGLYGMTKASKAVVSTVDPNLKNQVIFTSILDFDDANGVSLNEMALVMNNGKLYSMATFGDLNKTSSIQITWSWRISFI